MKRYDINAYGDNDWNPVHREDGAWVRYEDVSKLEAAARSVLNFFGTGPFNLAKHEKALAELRKALE